MTTNQYTNFSTPAPRPAQTDQVTVGSSTTSGVKPRDKYKLLLYKLGITEVVLGATACMLWLASIALAVTAPPYCPSWSDGQCYKTRFVWTYVSAGLWCGVFLFASGGLGISARKNPSVCMYNANMALSIISAVMMGVLIVMSAVTATAYEAYRYPTIKAPHGLLAVVGVAGMVICIVHSAYCCAGTCCRKKQYHGAVMYSARPQQYVQLLNGQLMLIQAQPMLPQNYPVMMMNAPGNFQPHAGATGTMMPPGAAACYPMNVPPEGMPAVTIPSQPAVVQAPVPNATAKQQEAEGQLYLSEPPNYDGHHS